MENETFNLAALGQSIAQRRRRFGWSQAELADRARIPRSALRHLEAGQAKRVDILVVARVAWALGAGVDDVLRDAGLSTAAAPATPLEALVRRLDPVERDALFKIGEILAGMRGSPATAGSFPDLQPAPQDQSDAEDSELADLVAGQLRGLRAQMDEQAETWEGELANDMAQFGDGVRAQRLSEALRRISETLEEE
jgi:transcriptional regulator with XRE-family HTH domain